MTKKVRHGVFETNSSSSHSISIAKGDYIVDKLGIENGVCRVYTGEFGWGYEQYYDAATKAAYCLTYVGSGDSLKKDLLKRVIEEVMGVPVEFANEDGGYIDHQSSDVAGDAFESEESLKAFIFNPSSRLIIDHDNHTSFDNLAIAQLNVRSWLSPGLWDRAYMGEDGSFTMYLDAVSKTFAVTSTGTRIPVGNMSIKDMFCRVRQLSNNKETQP